MADYKLVPNWFIDEMFPELTFSEIKVSLFFISKLSEEKDKTGSLANSEIIKGTGLSENSVINAIKGLEEKKVIEKNKNIYRLTIYDEEIK